MKNRPTMLLRATLVGILITTSAATGQQMVPAHNGSCPSGTSHAGAGYCKGR
jgi:hypothetical protein